MPLPPAPSKRGHKLAQEAIEQTRRSAKARPAKPAPAPSAAPARLLTAPATPAIADKPRTRATPPLTAPAPAPAPAAKTARKVPAKVPAQAPAPRAKAAAPHLFVLDTNVLLHDPTALFRFQEHDIFLPMVVLEELDAHKRGMTEVARNGRQSSRQLDALVSASGADMARGLPLNATGHVDATGKLYFQTAPLNSDAPSALPPGKADNQILGVVAALAQQHAPRKVALVSKDINMRVKARALGLHAEDYKNDRTLDDGDLLYAGALALPADFWQRQGKKLESWQAGGEQFYRITSALVDELLINQFVYWEQPDATPFYARVTEVQGKSAVLKTLRDFSKSPVWGVAARNREQNFALNLLMDPEIDLVTITGTAGTGKTLLALAAGLNQVLEERRYTEIIMTRATVNVGEDIGFLPGTEEEKMGPWMGALDDNLEFLTKGDQVAGTRSWNNGATQDLVRSRIKIKSLNFMRGRTFLNKWVIVDEAQNLTPKQIKTLITRAGPGSKIICMGNLAQIDTPYLTEGSSGLTYAVDRFKGWPYGGHITLARGERSRLADYASEVL